MPNAAEFEVPLFHARGAVNTSFSVIILAKKGKKSSKGPKMIKGNGRKGKKY
jgi:hypothetical protein